MNKKFQKRLNELGKLSGYQKPVKVDDVLKLDSNENLVIKREFQTELIKERQIHGIFSVKPGITGLAQVRGIDMADPKKLVEVENYMISNFRQVYYFKYLLLTFYGKGIGESINN